MKLFLGIIAFVVAVKGAMWLGSKLAKKDENWEPGNNDEDQGKSMFL
jgi:hypothetical protein